eukprot:767653-Rhodomonas_salina.1
MPVVQHRQYACRVRNKYVPDAVPHTACLQRMRGTDLAYCAQLQEAYVDMSLPRLLAPFVRLEVLGWDPLEDGQVPIQIQIGCSFAAIYGDVAADQRGFDAV